MMLLAGEMLGRFTKNVDANKNENRRDQDTSHLFDAMCRDVEAMSKKFNRDGTQPYHRVGEHVGNVCQERKTSR
jgi:hypothetical protein